MKKQYTIFISYRRYGGFETAKLIAATLRHAGYNVFLDIESLRAGKFNESLYDAIKQATDFILVLPANGIERCVNETDWARKEVIFAMSEGKNIIPVLLTGFQWPQSMPPGMEKLPNYQGINARDQENFDAAMEKLKGFLKSSPGTKYKKYVVTALLVIALILVAFGGIRQYSIPAAVTEADRITAKMGNIDLLVSQAELLDKEWGGFYKQYLQATTADTTFLKKEMRGIIDFRRKEVARLNKTNPWNLSETDKQKLNLRGIPVAELEIFHQTLYPTFFDDMEYCFSLLETYLNNFEFIPEALAETSGINYKLMKHSSLALYYEYMELMSDMPAKAQKSYYELSPLWSNFPVTTISLDKPREEYQRLQKHEHENQNKLIGEMGRITREQKIQLERTERMVQEMKTQTENYFKTANEVTTKKENIKKLSEDILSKQQQL